MIVTLIGYRGCGKSSVAPRLAERLGWRAIDADVELERRAGKTIGEIFRTDGEPAFRALERALLAELLERERFVLSAGGGAVLDPAIRGRMVQAGPVVWLTASVATIVGRISTDASTAARRPSLTDAGLLEEIESVLTLREPIYRSAATLVVSTDERALDDVVDEIVRGLPPGLAAPHSEGARS